MPKTQTRTQSLALTLVLFCLSCAALGLVSLYFSTGVYGADLFFWYFTQPLVVILNVLPLVVLGLLLAYAGGGAGLFSMIIGGWANGAIGSTPVTRAVQY